MTGLLAADTEKRRAGFFAIKAGMQAGMRSGDGLAKTFSKYARELLSTFKADGIWLRIDGQDHQHGVTATLDSHAVLSDWLAGLDPQQIFHSNSIAPELSPYPDLVRHVSGVLYIPLGERGFVLFCRNEQHENVQWAGRQEVTADGRIDEFTPRNSFEAWTEEVKGQSLDWHVITLESAMRLHELLLDHLEKTELEQKALQDGLTGLANRTMFESELETAIDVSKSTGSIVAVFMLDLDKFKPVNDTWGHAAGDDLLIQVGERLQRLVRDRDVVARFGGDEFSVILYHFGRIEEVEMVATRIIEEIRRPFKLKDTEVEIGASLGIALYPEHASGQKELIEKADAALYEVKRSGRNAWRFYEP
ncbi:MAG: sensor domain-containing diguanylate cyclase, partial [Gammaproteobacteria bacterium]